MARTTVLVVLLSVAAGVLVQFPEGFPSVTGPRHASKPYTTVQEFYPHCEALLPGRRPPLSFLAVESHPQPCHSLLLYCLLMRQDMSEHLNAVCRLLHIVGTTIVTSLLLFTGKQRLLWSILSALVVGLAMCGANRGAPNGAMEFGVVLVTYFGLNGWLGGSLKHACSVLFIGYGFAWIGHFFFEHNKPATFIYPAYSLVCDYVMWFRVLSGLEPLDSKAPAPFFTSATRVVQSLLQ